MKLLPQLIEASCYLGLQASARRAAYTIAPSSIHGFGAFAATDIEVGSEIATAYFALASDTAESRVYGGTRLGRFVNHSVNPNVALSRGRERSWVVIAIRPIRRGQELTSDYAIDCPKLATESDARFVYS